MKTKLEMAHEYALQLSKNPSVTATHNDKDIASRAWEYADAMQAEADKREKEEAAQKRKEIREILNAPNTFVEREGQHFDDVEEWQPDWSQAPDDATAWEYLGHSSARWHTTTKGMYKSAELFGFSSVDMLILERPQ